MGDLDPIVVTGMGALGGGAGSAAALYEAALTGRSPAEWVELPGIDRPLAASRAPDPVLGAEFRYARRLDRSAALGLAAAREAILQARLLGVGERSRIGVLLGSSRGPVGRGVAVAQDFATGSVSATSAAETGWLSLSGLIAQVYGLGGQAAVISATCASAAVAICIGALHIAADEADAMVVGGTEAPLVAEIAAQLVAARVTGWDNDPTRTCKPFDEERNGLMMGEGAGALVIERESKARARGVEPLARLSGWAYGADDGGRTGLTADGAGLSRVVARALRRAAIKPSRIGYINAHGTATRLNDPIEARALSLIFGDGQVPPLSSTKPITGHCLGSTPALEAILAVESMRAGRLPPTANHRRLDPACPVDVIAGAPRQDAVSAVLSTSMGFWGVQAALIFEQA